ncbi:MAG: hypothetical protein FWC00_02755 [Firmicutes bacterium]|nr:hypothetical protein [Bacillota bacterium]
MQHRKEVDQYLDALYNNNVRCPYCRAKIRKYTTVCVRCGMTKRQIHQASNLEAKKILQSGSNEKVLTSRRRPEDVSFTGMAMRGIIGFTGLHCFFVGRKIRGWIIASFAIIGLVGALAPMSWRQPFNSVYLFEDLPVFFPTDYFLLVGAMMWWIDLFSIVFGFFKYPIRMPSKDLAEVKTGKKTEEPTEPTCLDDILGKSTKARIKQAVEPKVKKDEKQKT